MRVSVENVCRLLKQAEVLALVGIERPTLQRWRRLGTFPQPLKIGPRALRWNEAEVQEWLQTRPRG